MAAAGVDWAEPAVFEFNSDVANPAPDPSTHLAGAFSGDLNLVAVAVQGLADRVSQRQVVLDDQDPGCHSG